MLVFKDVRPQTYIAIELTQIHRIVQPAWPVCDADRLTYEVSIRSLKVFLSILCVKSTICKEAWMYTSVSYYLSHEKASRRSRWYINAEKWECNIHRNFFQAISLEKRHAMTHDIPTPNNFYRLININLLCIRYTNLFRRLVSSWVYVL